ncbi:uncharacterized protein LOC112345476 isoform X2 [Selaginella moellendorffii]|uniref:uncharacterized protein LOC112345476 isoform X2 n=1 Tax=Selaginella moellendorffii TaxID=88036 RepID=UPI000D1CA855|nr:uncharacterized protein LOC112345476 isoform X2 [Selaginella moellendorffii]|eukprot:XP_024528107.1 uncharacterized protein LOC112345476 isoform X2 [Selaginella moellendorffii]
MPSRAHEVGEDAPPDATWQHCVYRRPATLLPITKKSKYFVELPSRRVLEWRPFWCEEILPFAAAFGKQLSRTLPLHPRILSRNPLLLGLVFRVDVGLLWLSTCGGPWDLRAKESIE